eukprot:COSAG05_NODE_544_length_8777_cov_13.472805_4_plen_115_part_00
MAHVGHVRVVLRSWQIFFLLFFLFLFRLVVYSGGISSRRRGGCRRAGTKRVVVFLVVHSAPIAETEEGWEGCPPVLTADKENVVHDAAKDLRRLRIDCSAGVASRQHADVLAPD